MENKELVIDALVKGKCKLLRISSKQQLRQNLPKASLAISGMDPGVSSEHPVKGKTLMKWSKTLNAHRYTSDKPMPKSITHEHAQHQEMEPQFQG